MRRTSGAVLALTAIVAVSGCGAAESAPSAAESGLTKDQAQTILREFDEGDSAATTSGDPAALAKHEAEPLLSASIAASRRAKQENRPQPGFTHRDPLFALPGRAADCLLVSGKVSLLGEELSKQSVSHFAKDASGAWKMDNSINLTQGAATSVAGFGQGGAVSGFPADDVKAKLRDELFARTTGTGTPGGGTVAPSPVLDNQFAAGWKTYEQTLAGQQRKVKRRLDGAVWSACGAPVGGGTVVFVTVRVTDVLESTGGAPVELAAGTPDLVATGHAEAVRGTSVEISRAESFLLLIPAGGPAAVLGLSDTATAVTGH
ncbi:hypothetical protein SAMN05421504_108262 [Amycolatopsis xylanica]|uniref:DUF8094 domain-containing protein n=1 Tax=Amycolatopsis xylanica TaxID=589385 RepID=A0A1H3PKB0_9PSEU|nr:hypothetical protein [Amycolatopsis xylanica]SDZ01527.1 hypothetical protein SAMN05421504_108262 [Amycolatopsis xylanica]